MNKFSMTCTCGDTMTLDAESREQAVMKFKEMMNEKAIAKHMSEKHPGQTSPSVAEVHAMIEQNTQAVM